MSSNDTHASDKEATTDGESTSRPEEGRDLPLREHQIFLRDVDPETLPRDGWTGELARRFEAFRDGRDGWQDGTVESQIDDWGGGDS